MPETLQGLIGGESYASLAVVICAVLLAGFLRGFVGFGAALVIIMVLSVVLGPVAAVPISSLAGIPAMCQLMPNAIRFSERRFVVPFGLATFAAAPLGTWILVSVDPDLMKIAISVFVLSMVVMLYRGWRLPVRSGRIGLACAGAAAGLVQGAGGVGGPPAVAIALSRPGTSQQQRANVIGVVNALTLCSLVPLWYHGLFTRDVVLISIVLVPLYVVSTWVGARFFSHSGHRHYRLAALLALAAIGVVTMVLSIRDFVAG